MGKTKRVTVKNAKKVTMNYDLKIFMGYRTYLYNFATTQTGGHVDFDYYKIY